MSTHLSVMTPIALETPWRYHAEDGSGWERDCALGCELKDASTWTHNSGLIFSHSFTTNKSSKVTGFRALHINFTSRPPVSCSVRQLEEKLILEVCVSPADSRSRLGDKLLITVQGARARRGEQRHSPSQAPSSSYQCLYTEDPPWSLPTYNQEPLVDHLCHHVTIMMPNVPERLCMCHLSPAYSGS